MPWGEDFEYDTSLMIKKVLQAGLLLWMGWVGCEAAKAANDLNKNGKVDTYEDSARPIDDRVENLLSLMTLVA